MGRRLKIICDKIRNCQTSYKDESPRDVLMKLSKASGKVYCRREEHCLAMAKEKLDKMGYLIPDQYGISIQKQMVNSIRRI